MNQQEKNIIEGLFERLRQAQAQTGPRDPEAEALIRDLINRQPAAPYYMAQAILVQEQALQNLNARIQELEQELAQRPAGGGFLADLFGGGAWPPLEPRSVARSQNATLRFQQAQGSFLGSALQTAAAVTGGVLLANAITGLFADEAMTAEPSAADDEPMEDDDSGDFGGDEF